MFVRPLWPYQVPVHVGDSGISFLESCLVKRLLPQALTAVLGHVTNNMSVAKALLLAEIVAIRQGRLLWLLPEEGFKVSSGTV